MTATTNQGTHGWWDNEPGNKKDRARFAALTEQAQRRVVVRSSLLYDGTRTVARCWKEALDEENAP